MTYVPVGYSSPPFPALLWPLKNQQLYYTSDVVRFGVYWTIIWMTGFYGSAALIATFTYYKNNPSGKKKIMPFLIIGSVYVVVGVIQAVLTGALIGVLIAEIYKSAQLGMSPWMPFIYAVIVVLFNITTSYSLTSVLL